MAFVGVLAGCAAHPPLTAPRVMVEDFEEGRTRWRDAGSGSRRTEVRLVDGGVGGRRAARVEFSGGADGWTDLTWPVERWPEGATAVSVWARAPHPSRILLKVNLGPTHEDLEMWGREIELGPGWREFVVGVPEFARFVWGHRHSPAPDPARIVGIGFAEVDFPVVFEVDRIAIR